MKQWFISWDQSNHSLTWVHGDIKQAKNPVIFVGIDRYVRSLPGSSSFPMINFAEWTKLLNLRKEIPQSMVPHIQKASDDYFDQITKDVFPFEFSAILKSS